jgi:LysR family transcriptional regulator, transcriptional activator for bauABCD operon
VFKAVVESRGFTNAQAILNVGQSTISNQVSQLEGRLGFRLCERGRTGFRLTSKGENVYQETLKLFKAHEHFQNTTSELKGKLSGFLNIAVVDNVITDAQCPIVKALQLFNERDHEVTIRLEIMAPNDMERRLLEMDIDVGVGTFENHLPGLEYHSIYVEDNVLLCGRAHPLFSEKDNEKRIHDLVNSARKVTRGYLDERDLYALGEHGTSQVAFVENLEAAAILILGGGHIGFLPKHYVNFWTQSDQMSVILPHSYIYKSDFYIAMRKGRRKSMILKAYLKNLYTAVELKNQTPT